MQIQLKTHTFWSFLNIIGGSFKFTCGLMSIKAKQLLSNALKPESTLIYYKRYNKRR